MGMNEKQLGQIRINSTTATSVYSPSASMNTVIKNIVVCNTSAATAKYRIFCDDNGTTYNQSTALFYDIEILADTTHLLDTFIAMNNSTGNLAVYNSVANAITFTLFGVEVTA